MFSKKACHWPSNIQEYVTVTLHIPMILSLGYIRSISIKSHQRIKNNQFNQPTNAEPISYSSTFHDYPLLNVHKLGEGHLNSFPWEVKLFPILLFPMFGKLYSRSNVYLKGTCWSYESRFPTTWPRLYLHLRQQRAGRAFGRRLGAGVVGSGANP